MKKSESYKRLKPRHTKGLAEFMCSLPPKHQDMVERIREIIFRVDPTIEESIKWDMPCYTANGNVCYIASFKKHINFGFYKGAEIIDRERLLEGTGKSLRHVKIYDMSDIRRRAFTKLIKQAVQLNVM